MPRTDWVRGLITQLIYAGLLDQSSAQDAARPPLEREQPWPPLRVVRTKGSTEYRFHPKRRWRFDLVLELTTLPPIRVGAPPPRIAVEMEGLVWATGGKSRHTTPAGYTKDCEKYAEALIMGWRVLRVTQGQVKDGSAAEWVRRLFQLPESR